METIKQIFRIGSGPSSSHTMGPRRAAEQFRDRCPQAKRYDVTLYGSLAATGKGHMTDAAILETLTPVAPTEILWKPDIILPFHPNGMKFEGFDDAGKLLDTYMRRIRPIGNMSSTTKALRSGTIWLRFGTSCSKPSIRD